MSNIGKRVGRIVSGSINALVDAVENAAPEAVMEQALREIDEAIAEVRVSLGKVTAEKHLATKKLSDNSNKHDALAQQIEVALNEGREDLAEPAVERQMDLEAQIPVLEATVKDCDTQEDELEGYIKALKGKRAEMKEELAAFRKRQAEAPENAILNSAGTPNPQNDVNAKVDAATATFDRVSGQHMDMANGDPVKLAELEELARKSEVQKRLEAIKANRSKE